MLLWCCWRNKAALRHGFLCPFSSPYHHAVVFPVALTNLTLLPASPSSRQVPKGPKGMCSQPDVSPM